MTKIILWPGIEIYQKQKCQIAEGIFHRAQLSWRSWMPLIICLSICEHQAAVNRAMIYQLFGLTSYAGRVSARPRRRKSPKKNAFLASKYQDTVYFLGFPWQKKTPKNKNIWIPLISQAWTYCWTNEVVSDKSSWKRKIFWRHLYLQCSSKLRISNAISGRGQGGEQIWTSVEKMRLPSLQSPSVPV